MDSPTITATSKPFWFSIESYRIYSCVLWTSS